MKRTLYCFNYYLCSNIHRSIGNVRSFSTNSKFKNRQNLFQENYNLITDILEKNYNTGSYAVQKEI